VTIATKLNGGIGIFFNQDKFAKHCLSVVLEHQECARETAPTVTLEKQMMDQIISAPIVLQVNMLAQRESQSVMTV
jgi:hypothetical protein